MFIIPFSIQMVEREILSLISEEFGFMTPLNFIEALEHFSAVFGFGSPGSNHRRCKKLALDYSKKSQEKKQAPPFSIPFLDYLCKAVLDESKKIEHRIVQAKLRLCTQASVHHSDLATTALSRVEWCRVVGDKAILGLRARAGKTKSGPLVILGVGPENDEGFVRGPPVYRGGCHVGQAGHHMEDYRREILSESEFGGLRWRSCKHTLTTLMVHAGILQIPINPLYQAACRKASESMIDLYLREAQFLVIKAQMEVLDQV